MRPALLVSLGMLAGAGILASLNYAVQRSETATPMRAVLPSEEREQARVAPQQQPDAGVDRGPALVSDERGTTPGTIEPQTSSEWNALVDGMLQWQVEHRTGKRLSPAQRSRLVAELARLREASIAQQEAPAEPGDPAELRERLARTLTIARVDAAFREELGIGVSEFVREMDPDAVEHVPRP